MSNPSERILVLGKDTRSFLATVRSLGRAGLEVHAGWHGGDAIALRSKYLARVHHLPEPDVDAGWEDPILELLERERFDLVLATNDPASVALHSLRDRLEAGWNVHLPPARAHETCGDKLATWELARELGIAVPRQERVVAPAQVDAVAAELGFPVVVKPRTSFALGRRKWEHNVARVAPGPAALRAYVEALLEVDEALVQEQVPGIGVGIEVLCEGGAVLLAFQHRRLHELHTGGSSYRVSERLDPVLLDEASRLMRAVGYTGLAMVEFRAETSAERHWLLEINARPWGSLPLALASGADFPRALHRLLVHGDRSPPSGYRVGVRCRHWWMDLHWLEHHPEARARIPFALLGLLAGRERSDTFTLDDPRPGLADAARILHASWSIARDRAWRMLQDLGPLRRRRARRLLASVRDARRLLVVCRGNICRSPFAERLARDLLPDGIAVASAGFRAEEGRVAPREAVEAARAHGVDLTLHSARPLDPTVVSEADLILACDEPSRRAVAASHPEASERVRLLGALAPDAPLNLKDPYGGPFDGFVRAFAEVARALEPLRRLSPQDPDEPASIGSSPGAAAVSPTPEQSP